MDIIVIVENLINNILRDIFSDQIDKNRLNQFSLGFNFNPPSIPLQVCKKYLAEN